ncbi:MAG: hypothetical protein JWP66_402 [Naasia sp.]|nr:hypothetical protein [Naasia sp.]
MDNRPRRRVRTEPVPGSDPAPQLPDRIERAAEDADEVDGGEGNDERLRRDVPPHW